MGEPIPLAVAAVPMSRDPDDLVRQLSLVQNRAARLLAAQAFTIEKLNSQVVELRGLLVARETAVAALREELAAMARN